MDDLLRVFRREAVSRGAIVFLAAVCVLATDHQPLFAGGRDFVAQQHDLRIVVDTRWAGCRYGGYYPIRIRVTNTGPARNLTFRFAAHDQRLPRVERTLGLEQNATVQLTLPIPMVGPGNYGTLAVFSGGSELKGLHWDLSLPDVVWNEVERPSILVISANNIDLSPLELAVQSHFVGGRATASRFGYSSGPSISEDHQIVSPLLLPDSWIDYTGIDVAMISLDVLAGLPSGPRSALVAWVEAGGTLVVTNVGGPPESSESLRKALSLEGRGLASPWTKANAKRRDFLASIVRYEPQEEVTVSEGEPNPAGLTQPPDGSVFSWPESADAFQQMTVLQGNIVAFPANPFPGTARDWKWLLASLPAETLHWTRRHGFTSRMPHSEFLQFEIPGLRGVPASAFLGLITLFSLCIGPINYFVLWRKKKLWMLVVTIPVISFLTSVSLFGYSTIAHGFSVKSRTRSLTVLDQQHKTAVTTARISLFAGLAPSRGLEFSPETSVSPIWPNTSDSLEMGTVDWTNTQALESNWLRSRTRTQFVTVNHRTERGRLVVGTPENGTLPVENGFTWGIEFLVVADASGATYCGGPIAAGAGARLEKVSGQQQLEPLRKILDRHPLKMPEEAQTISGSTYNSFRRGPYYESSSTSMSLSTSRTERQFSALKSIAEGGRNPESQEAKTLEPKSYVASFSENPGVEMGVPAVQELAPLHLLLGYY